MDRRRIERILAVTDAKESGSLLEGFGSHARHRGELHARPKLTMLIAKLDHLQRGPLVDTRDVAQQRPGRGVQVDAHAVDTALDDRLERLVKLRLIDVMLILSDADRLGVDLHELGERVLEAAGNRDGAAYGEVEIGKLLPRKIRSRVDGCAGFVDCHAENGVQLFLLEELADERVGLARGRSVADGDGAHLVLRDQGEECTLRAGDIVLRLMGINDGVFQELAGVVNHRDLATRPDTGIDGQDAQRPGGRGEQQVLQILAEDLDGVHVGALLEFQPNVGLNGEAEQPLVAILNREFEVRRPVAGRFEDLRFQVGDGARGVQLNLEVDDVFVLAAADRQHTMRRNLRGRLAIVVVHLELVLLVLRILYFVAHHNAFFQHHLAQDFSVVGILADHFGDNVARAFQGFPGVRDALFRIDKRRGELARAATDRGSAPAATGTWRVVRVAFREPWWPWFGAWVCREDRDLRVRSCRELSRFWPASPAKVCLAPRWCGGWFRGGLRVRGNRPAFLRRRGFAPRPDCRWLPCDSAQ